MLLLIVVFAVMAAIEIPVFLGNKNEIDLELAVISIIGIVILIVVRKTWI